MESREILIETFNFKKPERVPITEWVYWPDTIERWRREGLPMNVDPIEYFGMDRMEEMYYDRSLGFEEKVLSEDDESVTKINSNGVTVRSWKKRYAPPQYLDFTVKTEEDWFKVKDRLRPTEGRLKTVEGPLGLEKFDAKTKYQDWRSGNVFLSFFFRDPCWLAMNDLIGMKNTLTNMYTKQEWLHDLFRTYVQLDIEMYKIALEMGMEFDAIRMNGDLCYKNGMMFSPKIYDKLLYPYHKMQCDFAKSKGLPVIYHCDGNVKQYIPLLIKAGVTAIHPLEARAGNDVREYKKLYGEKIVLIGNISAESMSAGKKEVEAEVKSKLPVAMEGGGYVFNSDHSVPPTVSLENYAYTIQLAKKYGRY